MTFKVQDYIWKDTPRDIAGVCEDNKNQYVASALIERLRFIIDYPPEDTANVSLEAFAETRYNMELIIRYLEVDPAMSLYINNALYSRWSESVKQAKAKLNNTGFAIT